jgi:hypothetical protein
MDCASISGNVRGLGAVFLRHRAQCTRTAGWFSVYQGLISKTTRANRYPRFLAVGWTLYGPDLINPKSSSCRTPWDQRRGFLRAKGVRCSNLDRITRSNGRKHVTNLPAPQSTAARAIPRRNSPERPETWERMPYPPTRSLLRDKGITTNLIEPSYQEDLTRRTLVAERWWSRGGD